MKARAYVVGPRRGAAAALFDLAGRLEFEAVLSYTSVVDVERHASDMSIVFFLFAEVPDLEQLRPATQAIRAAGSRNLRFAPLVYFCTTPSIETVRKLIGMGFDDVIAGPFSPSVVRPRLARQLDVPLAYFETATYFGPDRRRRDDPRYKGPMLRSGDPTTVDI